MRQRFVLDSWASSPNTGGGARRFPCQTTPGAATGRPCGTLRLDDQHGRSHLDVGRAAGAPEAYKALDYIRSLSLRILAATDEAVLAAARNKIEHPISYADAFAVAAAQEHQATLVTGDPELLRLDGPVRIEMLSRNGS